MKQVTRDQRVRVIWVLQDFNVRLTKVFSFSFFFSSCHFWRRRVQFIQQKKVRQHSLKVNHSAAAHNTSFLELHNYNIYEDSC